MWKRIRSSLITESNINSELNKRIGGGNVGLFWEKLK